MLDQSDNLNYCFWLCFYFRSIFVSRNCCFIFSKNLILSLIDKVTTGTKSLVTVIPKFTPVMLLFSSINTQSFVRDKSSSISQFINSKSIDLQKLLRYLSGIVTSTFKADTGGRFVSLSFPGLSGVVPSIFVLYSNHLASEALSSA